jgi:hypothetical protein
MTHRTVSSIVLALGVLAALPPAAAAAGAGPAPDSQRLARAKDLIADEEWDRAIAELRAAVDDPKEKGKPEALFWLAHSLNQDNDFASAVEIIRQLERDYASSAWVRPARSLLIELAQKLKREDVLWWTAVRPARPRTGRVTPQPAPGRARAPRGEPKELPPAGTPVAPSPPVPAAPPSAWVVEHWSPDTDQRILALRTLIQSDAAKVIPMLRTIALEDNPGPASRAVFVLAQSRKPEALSTVVEVAKKAADPVRVAAVRSLGSFGGPEISQALLQVYSSANPPVKRQVVFTLGDRAEAPALMRIAQSEKDLTLRATAITTLGRAGGRSELLSLYPKVDGQTRQSIIQGLFAARGEEELIRIAESETDPRLRNHVLSRLRLLGTPKARAYLAKEPR